MSGLAEAITGAVSEALSSTAAEVAESFVCALAGPWCTITGWREGIALTPLAMIQGATSELAGRLRKRSAQDLRGLRRGQARPSRRSPTHGPAQYWWVAR